jgi:hypothetical protein
VNRRVRQARGRVRAARPARGGGTEADLCMKVGASSSAEALLDRLHSGIRRVAVSASEMDSLSARSATTVALLSKPGRPPRLRYRKAWRR